MKKAIISAIFAMIGLLVAPVIASAMTNIPAEPKKGSPAPKQAATQAKIVHIGGTKTKEQDSKKDSSDNQSSR